MLTAVEKAETMQPVFNEAGDIIQDDFKIDEDMEDSGEGVE